MHSDLIEIGWTEEHLNRIQTAISEEAQRARVAAQVLTVVGPLDPTVVAVPSYGLSAPNASHKTSFPAEQRLTVDSDPTLHVTKIAVNVYIRAREAADPELNAALTMFRRAANYIARIEDALVFNGRPDGNDSVPEFGLGRIPHVYHVSGLGPVDGLLTFSNAPGERNYIKVLKPDKVDAKGMPSANKDGNDVVQAVVESIDQLDAAGQLGPYACFLSAKLFELVCKPNDALVLPRDRILPFLQGPLLRSSAINNDYGVVIALSANPIELVVARDIQVKFLQTTEQPLLAFQVSERIALRIKETAAISVLT